MTEEEISEKILNILTEENLSFGQIAGILENIKFIMWVAHIEALRKEGDEK